MPLARFALATALGLALVGPVLAHDPAHHMMQMDSAAPLPGGSIYNLNSEWTTQDGHAAPIAALRGHPVVAAMAYTTCKDMCPAIVADMLWIQKHLPPKSADGVRFAFFSFDSKADTPARLKAYADEHGLAPERWTLFHGDDDAVRDLAAALAVAYRPDGQGGFDHAAVISLLDSDGNVVFQQRGAQASSQELLAKLGQLNAAGR